MSRLSCTGSRGLIRELWSGHEVNELSELTNLTSSDAGYHRDILPEAAFPEEPTLEKYGKFSSRIRGYFVPPHTGTYINRSDL